jgi:N-carbamoyl-L-amino-acid hydrolase
MVSKSAHRESTNEQGKAGLTDCTPEEFARIQQLNADYNAKFGFPFILAVRGPRGTGLPRAADHRDLRPPAGATRSDFEREEACATCTAWWRLRLNDKFGVGARAGRPGLGLAGALAQHSDPGFKEKGQLTVTYLTDAHRAAAKQIEQDMREAASTRWPSMRWATWSACTEAATPGAKGC